MALNANNNNEDLKAKLGKKALNAVGVPPALSNRAVNTISNISAARRDNIKNSNLNNQAENEVGADEDKQTKSSATQLAEGAKKTFNFLTSKNPSDILKRKIILYVAGGVGSLLLFMVVIIGFILLVTGPIQAVVNVVTGAIDSIGDTTEKLGNFFTFKGYTTNKDTFYNEINKQYIKYNEKGVTLDVPLIVSTIFVDREFNPDIEYCASENEDECKGISSDEYVKMRTEATELAEGMVYEAGRKYYCTTYELTGKLNPYGAPETKEVKNECGTTLAGCACKGGTKSYETIYALKSEDDYKEWLRSNFLTLKFYKKAISDFLVDNPSCITTDPSTEKSCQDAQDKYIASLDRDKQINDWIDNIYQRRDLYTVFSEAMGLTGTNSSYGDFITGIGYAGSIPNDLKNNLSNPLGSQSCRQTSCYGVYLYEPGNKLSCKDHSGIDLVSPGINNAGIYSIADGTILYMTDYGRSCPVGTPNCPGRGIKILHNITVGGKTYNIVSFYHHLASFADSTLYKRFIEAKKNNEEINISKGQYLGIMGKTGTVTGVHLHFEIIDVDSGKYYDPDDIFNSSSCNLMNCDAARKACSGF